MESQEKIKEVLTRGVVEIIDQSHLEKRLASGERLRIKFGIDPTSPDVHLGHAVPLFKLKQFQDLGHQIVLIIGDFTAQIGDPSGRSEERKPLTEAEIKKNLKTYLAQAGKIIDIKKTEVHYNSKWLKKLDGAKLLNLLGQASVQQILEREDFQKRLAEKKSISLHETVYPLFQAFDSVQIKADVEIGGTDQKFNLLAGRTLMKKMGLSPQDIITLPLLIGLDGARKMSKSLRNYIALEDKPEEMFGKIMSLPDNLVPDYFRLLTALAEEEIEKISHDLSPRDFKVKLAVTIVNEIHGTPRGDKAAESFRAIFQQNEIPKDAPAIEAKVGDLLIEVVLKSGLVSSKNEIKRLIDESAVSDFKTGKISDYHFKLSQPLLLRIGKHRFLKILVK